MTAGAGDREEIEEEHKGTKQSTEHSQPALISEEHPPAKEFEGEPSKSTDLVSQLIT